MAGSSLERFTALAETMGLPRVVRSMEILGHALVDMREAPDAQVVLEIAVVRAVRPDLDSGAEALSERVSVLERSLSGAAAFPRPGAPPERAASRPGVGLRPAGAAALAGAGTRRARAGRWVGAPPSAPCGGARRSRRGVRGVRARPPSARRPDDPARPTPPRRPPPAAEAAARPPAVDRDSLTEAWGDGILQPCRPAPRPSTARAASSRRRAGRPLRTAQRRASRPVHRDLVPTVEAALAAHFGTPVTLVLEVDDASRRPGRTGRRPARPGAAGPRTRPTSRGDPADFAGRPRRGRAATDQASAAEARLLEAFPGASEVAG